MYVLHFGILPSNTPIRLSNMIATYNEIYDEFYRLTEEMYGKRKQLKMAEERVIKTENKLFQLYKIFKEKINKRYNTSELETLKFNITKLAEELEDIEEVYMDMFSEIAIVNERHEELEQKLIEKSNEIIKHIKRTQISIPVDIDKLV